MMVCLLMFISIFAAVAEDELAGEAEARAKLLFSELRCVVCQNQSIRDSDADVAKDLRIIVREQITAGKTDREIRTFLVDRYGEYILLKPVFAWHTFILWAAPFLLIILAGALIFRAGRKQSDVVESKLSDEEEKELARLLER
jgi:cytochrome c-type biogenesis protein CcmH